MSLLYVYAKNVHSKEKDMKYYMHHIGDFKKDTSYLTHRQRSIYMEMLWMYYDEERPLVKDTKVLALKCQATIEEIELLLSLYFNEEEKCYRHRRIDNELEATYKKSEMARKSAEARWGNDSMRSHTERNANDMLPNTHNPLPNNNNMSEIQELCDKTFIEFWDMYPKVERKVGKVKCEEKWKARKLYNMIDKIKDHIRSMKETKQWKEGFVPAPLTYINQSRWEDDITKPLVRKAITL